MNKFVTITQNEPTSRALKPNPNRGSAMKEIALRFAERFPLEKFGQPKNISIEDLDQWLDEQNLLVLPPVGTPKDSDAWLGHLQRRHQCIQNINKASTHPRMRDEGSHCYIIKPQYGRVIIRAPHEQIAQGEIPTKITTILRTRRQQLRYLMESADWEVLPAEERVAVKYLTHAIDGFEETVMSQIRTIGKQFNELASAIQKAVDSKMIIPKNGGINNVLSNLENITYDDVNDDEEDWQHPS
jgi:hypothetical protein